MTRYIELNGEQLTETLIFYYVSANVTNIYDLSYWHKLDVSQVSLKTNIWRLKAQDQTYWSKILITLK
jgi:hypothetical protein